ncbi:hypothetical protein [Streptomyces sp. DSM 40907]|uniref:hypothetical protein n=1 Tax=Streptomyces kutzneri TaxID=3051179 RepID=UPI0028D23CC1|nr:hypothetical protein [Streptomyces sp. DSM 40907]
MFASVLPGIRELRTPLATGYIYLLTVFLIMDGKLPTRSKTPQLLAPLYDIMEWMGKPAVLAAVTFVAYIVGSVLRVHPAAISRGIRRATSQGILRSYRETLEELWAIFTDTTSRFVVWADLRVEDVGAEVPTPSVTMLQMYVRDKLGFDQSNRTIGGGVTVLLEDLQVIGTRLYASNKDLYGDYDRLTAEADLKVNVGLSAIVLSCVAAFQLNPLWALLCGPMVFLACRGLSSARQANGVLVQAIVTGVVTSPQFEEYARLVAKDKKAANRRTRFDRLKQRFFKENEDATPSDAH